MTDPASGAEIHEGETLEDFARSLSYGQRSDLSFKFLAGLDGSSAGDRVASILGEVGAVFDTGDPSDLIDTTIAAQVDSYRSRSVHERYRYEEGPFASPARPVAESRLALITSSGHFVADDDPKPFGIDAMTQQEAEERINDFLKEAPVLSEIPVDCDETELRVRHGGYDIRGARADHNVVFPIDRLRELDDDGVVGSLCETAYSFVGACAQMRLINEIGPRWANRIASTGTDIALLVPA